MKFYSSQLQIYKRMPKKMEKKKNLTRAFNGNAMLGLGCSQEHPDLKTKILKKKKKKKKRKSQPTKTQCEYVSAD